MTPNVRLAQLYAVRALVDSLITQDELGIVETTPICLHPEDKRRDATTAGGPRQFLCLACGQTVDGTV